MLNGKGGSIERTGKFSRTIKNIDYDLLDRYINKATYFEKDKDVNVTA